MGVPECQRLRVTEGLNDTEKCSEWRHASKQHGLLLLFYKLWSWIEAVFLQVLAFFSKKYGSPENAGPEFVSASLKMAVRTRVEPGSFISDTNLSCKRGLGCQVHGMVQEVEGTWGRQQPDLVIVVFEEDVEPGRPRASLSSSALAS